MGRNEAKQRAAEEKAERIRTKDFFACIAPSTIKFYADHYIVGDSYRCAWAVREYPPSTDEQAIFAKLAEKNGVTLRIYHRLVEPMEQRKIIQNAARKNKLKSNGNDVSETVEAEGNLQDVIELLANIRKNRECLLHCSVFIELKAPSLALLKELQSEVMMDLARSKISADRLTLRQKEGFLSVQPVGANQFGAQFERVLPASSAANFYPFSFSGKTDPHGLYIGRDKFGTNILTDFDRRAEDKTTSNILILGNSGQGKSYLLKLILTNIRESGKRVICLDPESEYGDLCAALGGSYVDFLSGENTINPLEPKTWTDTADDDPSAPEAFRKTTRLSQHIAFLKDFFRSYKDFDDAQIDTIEILLAKLYEKFGITDETDYASLTSADYPIMEDFYRLCEEEYRSYDRKEKQLYTEETLQTVCLGIHSMCVGAESTYFNGHTNIGMDTLQTLKTHIGIGLGTAEKEENTVEIEFRIAQIDAEFKSMIDTASADTVDGFDENRMQQLIAEKNELQEKLGEIDEERGRQQTVQDRLETIYTVLDGLKNRPMTYDDEVVRQLIDCVVVESKDRIKVVFCGGLQVEQQLRQEDMDFLSEMGQIPVNI